MNTNTATPTQLFQYIQQADRTEKAAQESRKAALMAMRRRGIKTFKHEGTVYQIRVRKNSGPHLVVVRQDDKLPAL